jgi:hypothetical protein
MELPEQRVQVQVQVQERQRLQRRVYQSSFRRRLPQLEQQAQLRERQAQKREQLGSEVLLPA